MVTKPAKLECQYDIVVIGAGLGGLGCAAYLAQAGKRVLVCEQHDRPGGYCTAYPSPSGKFRVEQSMQYLMLCDDGDWVDTALRDLGVRDLIDFKPLDTFLRIIGPDYDVTLTLDRDHTEAEMIRQFPTEARTIHRLLEDASLMIRACYGETWA